MNQRHETGIPTLGDSIGMVLGAVGLALLISYMVRLMLLPLKPFRGRSTSSKLLAVLALVIFWVVTFLYLGHFVADDRYQHTGLVLEKYAQVREKGGHIGQTSG